MKRIFKIITILVLGLSLVSCDFSNPNYNEIDDNPPTETKDIPSIKEFTYIGTNDGKDEYLMHFSDGTSQIIYITSNNNNDISEITINDLYEAAVIEGYTGSMLDFIKDHVDISVDDSKEAIVKGLKSSVSVFSHFTKTEVSFPILGLPEQKKVEYTSAGSGIIYKLNKDLGTAYIITNHHVVYDQDSDTNNKISENIQIYLYGLELPDYEIEATYIGGSETHDVAVLKVENSEIIKNNIAEEVTSANSDLIEPGDTAIAIGNAEAKGISVTKGIVSVPSEYITMNTNNLGLVSFRVLRIDTAVNSGNSGGGLFNSKGEVIGIVNAKMVAENIDSIGYALHANTVFNLADNIIYYADNEAQENGEKVLIGITMRITDRVVSYDSNMDKIILKDIIKVEDIVENSPAEGKFMLDDQIVSVTISEKTYSINRLYELSDLLFKVKRNETITFTVNREETLVDLEITFVDKDFNLIV